MLWVSVSNHVGMAVWMIKHLRSVITAPSKCSDTALFQTSKKRGQIIFLISRADPFTDWIKINLSPFFYSLFPRLIF